jgi:transglutaminase-like putative cysteine protease
MEIDRRSLFKMAAAAAAKIAFSSMPALAFGEEQGIEALVEQEPYKWKNIQEYEYLGNMTEREAGEEELERGYTKKELFEASKHTLDDTQRLHYFSGRGSSIAFHDFVKPIPSEVREYNAFLRNLSGRRGMDLVREAYDSFQRKIGGTASTGFEKAGVGAYGSPLFHPAVIVSGRGKGICADKAFALYDILRKKGIDARVVSGKIVGQKDMHMWTRVYLDGDSFDLDPTWYEDFRVLRRTDYRRAR